MNERIKELMFDAGLNSNYIEGFNSIYSQQLERFAELIVKECALIAFHNVVNLSCIADAEDVEINMKEHFGVEE